jgi:hypothetical protein
LRIMYSTTIDMQAMMTESNSNVAQA